MPEHPLDELDRAILRQLEEDGRRALREIARNLGSAEATIRARVKRLQDHNILRIVAFADPEQLGDSQLSLLFLKVDPARHQEVVDVLIEMPEITYVSTLLGVNDVCVEVASSDNTALWNFVQRRVGSIPGVMSTETTPILKVHKLRYTTAFTE